VKIAQKLWYIAMTLSRDRYRPVRLAAAKLLAALSPLALRESLHEKTVYGTSPLAISESNISSDIISSDLESWAWKCVEDDNSAIRQTLAHLCSNLLSNWLKLDGGFRSRIHIMVVSVTFEQLFDIDESVRQIAQQNLDNLINCTNISWEKLSISVIIYQGRSVFSLY
jgi:hypothetical protein